MTAEIMSIRFAKIFKSFTSNVRVIIIIPATASAATAIINFKMKAPAQYDMQSVVLTEKPGKQHKMHWL